MKFPRFASRHLILLATFIPTYPRIPDFPLYWVFSLIEHVLLVLEMRNKVQILFKNEANVGFPRSVIRPPLASACCEYEYPWPTASHSSCTERNPPNIKGSRRTHESRYSASVKPNNWKERQAFDPRVPDPTYRGPTQLSLRPVESCCHVSTQRRRERGSKAIRIPFSKGDNALSYLRRGKKKKTWTKIAQYFFSLCVSQIRYFTLLTWHQK